MCSIKKINNTTSRSISIEINGKKKILDLVKKGTVHKFHMGYITHTSLKKHRTHREQVIKTFQSAFKLITLECIKNDISKNNVSVISLIVFHENRTILMYNVIGVVMYTIIDDYICLDYLGLLQAKLSKHDNNFQKPSSTIFIGW